MYDVLFTILKNYNKKILDSGYTNYIVICRFSW